MATDISVATVLMVTGHDPFYGINAGFVALCFNFTVTVMISLLMRLGASQSGDLSGQIKIGQVPRASESELPS